MPEVTSWSSVTVRLATTTVSPSRTRTRVSVFCVRKIKPMSESATSAADRSAWTVRRM